MTTIKNKPINPEWWVDDLCRALRKHVEKERQSILEGTGRDIAKDKKHLEQVTEECEKQLNELNEMLKTAAGADQLREAIRDAVKVEWWMDRHIMQLYLDAEHLRQEVLIFTGVDIACEMSDLERRQAANKAWTRRDQWIKSLLEAKGVKASSLKG